MVIACSSALASRCLAYPDAVNEVMGINMTTNLSRNFRADEHDFVIHAKLAAEDKRMDGGTPGYGRGISFGS